MSTDHAQAVSPDEWDRLRARIAHHKAVIRREREQLRQAAAALDAFERQCRTLGLDFIVQE